MFDVKSIFRLRLIKYDKMACESLMLVEKVTQADKGEANKSVTKRINSFINPCYMHILCNISECRVPRRGYIVKMGSILLLNNEYLNRIFVHKLRNPT